MLVQVFMIIELRGRPTARRQREAFVRRSTNDVHLSTLMCSRYCRNILRRRREDEAARARRAEQEESRRRMEAERKRLQDAVAPYTDKASQR